MEVQLYEKHPHSDGMNIGRKIEAQELDLSKIKVWLAQVELDKSKSECVAQATGCTSWIRAPGGLVCVEFLEGFFDKKQT